MAHQYKAGLHNVGSYQVSGIPYLTASLVAPGTGSAPLEIVFPSVTQRVIIHNHNTTLDLKMGLSVSGTIGTNFWLVDHETAGTHGTTQDFRIRTDRIFLQGVTTAVSGVQVFAELSGINIDFNLAAQYSGSPGIG